MFAALNYARTRHPYSTIQGQPDMNPHAAITNGVSNGDAQAQNGNDTGASTEEPIPDSPEVFAAALRELSRDFIIKEKQIEYIISVLPGIGNSEAEQNARIQALNIELRLAAQQRDAAMKDREQMLDLLGDLAAKCKRVY